MVEENVGEEDERIAISSMKFEFFYHLNTTLFTHGILISLLTEEFLIEVLRSLQIFSRDVEGYSIVSEYSETRNCQKGLDMQLNKSHKIVCKVY